MKLIKNTAKLLAFGIATLPLLAFAADRVKYDISFDNAVHNEARISVTYTDMEKGAAEFRMSRSSPGRYAIHEFAKNVYSVTAVDGQGKKLTITRPNPYQWDVAGHDGTVTLSYTLYAVRPGGTYSGIDLTHAHLNIPATFMWARGYDQRGVEVKFNLRKDWKVATQLKPTKKKTVYHAPNLQYFMDSPTELSNFAERIWDIKSNGKTYKIRLFVHHEGTEKDMDIFAEKAKKIVDAQIDIFGSAPDFDYGTYTFICDYIAHGNGAGMEHRNSTILGNISSLHAADFSQTGTLSHEFFHAWNVERIRPKGIEPFDFEQANMTFSLWLAEGFTSYYGGLTLKRVGEKSLSKYLTSLSGTINRVMHSPSRGFASPEGMSLRAPFVDAAKAVDPTNYDNVFVSYYTYGNAIAIGLDLTLRGRRDDLSLDSYMKLLWKKYGQPEIPYEKQDLEDTLAELTKDKSFAKDFFARYISNSEMPPYAALVEKAGLVLRLKNKKKATLGRVSFSFNGKAAIISRNTLIGTPLYKAGLDRGDRIIQVGRFKIDSKADWKKALKRHKAGEKVTITYFQTGLEKTTEITFAADQTLELVTFKKSGRKASKKQLAFRVRWLGNNETKDSKE